jgi:hypothetical protein
LAQGWNDLAGGSGNVTMCPRRLPQGKDPWSLPKEPEEGSCFRKPMTLSQKNQKIVLSLENQWTFHKEPEDRLCF